MSTAEVRMYLDTALLRSTEAQLGISKVNEIINEALSHTMFALEKHQEAMQAGWLDVANTVESLVTTFRECVAALDKANILTGPPADAADWAKNAVAAAIDAAGSQSDKLQNAVSGYIQANEQCTTVAGWLVAACDPMMGALVQPHTTAEDLIQRTLANINKAVAALEIGYLALTTADQSIKDYLSVL